MSRRKMARRRPDGNHPWDAALRGFHRKEELTRMAEHAPALIETEQVYADADAGLDHMGRRHAKSVLDALRMDWPWILALVLVMAFDIGALAGYFRT